MSPVFAIVLVVLCVLNTAAGIYLWLAGRAWRAHALESDSRALVLQSELDELRRTSIRPLETITVDDSQECVQ